MRMKDYILKLYAVQCIIIHIDICHSCMLVWAVYLVYQNSNDNMT